METLIEVGNETVETRTICYKKEFDWQIDSFEDWWSSREIHESERIGSDESTEEEELENAVACIITTNTDTIEDESWLNK